MLQPVSSQNLSSPLAIINFVTFTLFLSNLYHGPVYTCSSHPVYYSHQTTSQKFQLPNIFCKVDLYITVTLPFAKGDHCIQIWLHSVEPTLSNHPKYEDLVFAYKERKKTGVSFEKRFLHVYFVAENLLWAISELGIHVVPSCHWKFFVYPEWRGTCSEQKDHTIIITSGHEQEVKSNGKY